MPKIDESLAPKRRGSRYPSPYDEPCRGRESVSLGDAAKLTKLGAHKVRLDPGAWSSQRHWHDREDELVYVLEGEVTLVTDEGKTVLVAGDSAGFPAGTRDGHCFQNHGPTHAVLLVVGTRDDEDSGEYSDIDMKFGRGRYTGSGGPTFTKKDGTPF
jgi:uncharacterized cupin superfamily protein